MMRDDASAVQGSGGRPETAPLPPELVSLPGGDFDMGNPRGRPDERPVHRVRLRPFRVAVAPVTNAEYARFVAATDREAPPFAGDARFCAGDQPVVGVSWHDAVAYCAWLSRATGVAFRLPSEAEREFAALGGLEHADWPWGAPADGHPLAATIASLEQPHAPDAPCANGYGLRCMAENVHEWCGDWYDAAYYAISPVDAPAGPATGRRRASRGGSWRHMRKFTRVTARASLDPSSRYNDFGFRVYADV